MRLPGGGFLETTGQKMLNAGATAGAAMVKAAIPGVIFIDEVYQLLSLTNSEGRAITNAVLDATEESRKVLTVIVAGYKEDVEEKWLASNQGLRSRFPYSLTFADFSTEELRVIFLSIVRSKGWSLVEPPLVQDDGNGDGLLIDTALVAARRLQRGASRKGFANARSTRVLAESAFRRASTRMAAERDSGTIHKPYELAQLTRHDVLGAPMDPSSSPLVRSLLGMTGLDEVKAAVNALVRLTAFNYRAELVGEPVLEVSLHRLFLGNPGTGKTTVAKIYGAILAECGMLSSGEVIVIGASKLTGATVGSAGALVNAQLDAAAGKVLVIDEAYVLATTTYGKEALDVLVERVQGTPGEDFAVILCGYDEPMDAMLRDCNPGLARRFRKDDAFHFNDYSDEQLVTIMQVGNDVQSDV